MSTLDALAERLDLPLPMGDLLYSSAEKALLSPTTKGGYAGTETVAGTPCTHLAFQDTGVEWELWIPEQGEPLPKRFKVVRTKRTGQPAIDLTFASWEVAPQVTDADVHSETAGRLRGHRHAAEGGRGQEDAGRAVGAASGSRASSQAVAGASAIPRHNVTRGASAS